MNDQSQQPQPDAEKPKKPINESAAGPADPLSPPPPPDPAAPPPQPELADTWDTGDPYSHYKRFDYAPHAFVPPAWMKRWETDSFDVSDAVGMPWQRMKVGGGILKAQGAVARDLFEGRSLSTYITGFILLLLFSTAVYGAIIGSAAGLDQTALAAAKFPIVVLGSSLLCLPSFYIFQCLTGSRLTLAQAAASVLLNAAASGLILLGCAPIVWFFTVSTQADAWRFIVVLHLAVIAAAVIFGIHFLSRAHRYIIWKHPDTTLFDGRVLKTWFVLYVVVGVQMAYYMRPLMFDGPFWTGERGLFFEAIKTFFTMT